MDSPCKVDLSSCLRANDLHDAAHRVCEQVRDHPSEQDSMPIRDAFGSQ